MNKRKIFVVCAAAALSFLSAAARADQGDDNGAANPNSIELLVGPMFPLTKVKSASAEDDLGSTGFAAGGRFMRRIQPGISLGVEVQSLNSGDHSSDVLIPDANTTSSYNSYAFLAEMKFEAASGAVRPFFIGGLGFDSTDMTGSATPLPGYVWKDTGTRETRGLSSTKSSFAGTLQGGINIPIDEQLFAGLSIAWYYFGNANYDNIVSGSIASLTALASVGYRF